MSQSDHSFRIVDGVLDDVALGPVEQAVDAGFATRTRAGARHILQYPAVNALANHPRLLELAGTFVGSSPQPFRATLFDKSPDSNWLVAWHQDTALPLRQRVESSEWGPWSLKADVLYAHAPAAALEKIISLRVHLDDSTASNGPLRVLPDTHSLGVLSEDAIERLAREIPQVECLVSRGGVVAMRPLIVHASSKARDDQPRRVLHIEYAGNLSLGAGVELAIC